MRKLAIFGAALLALCGPGLGDTPKLDAYDCIGLAQTLPQDVEPMDLVLLAARLSAQGEAVKAQTCRARAASLAKLRAEMADLQALRSYIELVGQAEEAEEWAELLSHVSGALRHLPDDEHQGGVRLLSLLLNLGQALRKTEDPRTAEAFAMMLRLGACAPAMRRFTPTLETELDAAMARKGAPMHRPDTEGPCPVASDFIDLVDDR